MWWEVARCLSWKETCVGSKSGSECPRDRTAITANWWPQGFCVLCAVDRRRPPPPPPSPSLIPGGSSSPPEGKFQVVSVKQTGGLQVLCSLRCGQKWFFYGHKWGESRDPPCEKVPSWKWRRNVLWHLCKIKKKTRKTLYIGSIHFVESECLGRVFYSALLGFSCTHKWV